MQGSTGKFVATLMALSGCAVGGLSVPEGAWAAPNGTALFRQSLFRQSLPSQKGPQRAKAVPHQVPRNLIVNGDFERGKAGFLSDYTYSPGDISPQKTYDVVLDPHDSHAGAAAMHDHTSGSGRMLAVNGAAEGNPVVWKQTVPVSPGTRYLFGAWAANWGYYDGEALSPSTLRVSINGQPAGSLTTPAEQNGLWRALSALWYSGSSKTAIITIVDRTQTTGIGNNFTLDDLSLKASP